MTSPFRAVSPIDQLAAHLDARFDHLEEIVATKQQITEAFENQAAAFTDYADDVTAKMADLNAKLDAALANDSADAAALAEMKALSDDVLVRTNAMTEAIKAADVAVDRSAPEPTA